jgi:hypothetical protein
VNSIPSQRQTEIWNADPKRSNAKPGFFLSPLQCSLTSSPIADGQRQLVAELPNHAPIHTNILGEHYYAESADRRY